MSTTLNTVVPRITLDLGQVGHLPAQFFCTMCWFCVIGNIVVDRINEVDQRWPQLVLGWVTVRRQAGKLSQHVTSHPGQLSLAIPLWVVIMNTVRK